MTRRILILVTFCIFLSPLAARGQSLADQLDGLFNFGQCGEALCLFLDPSNNHGAHYLPALVDANGLMTGFLKNAVATSVGNLPFAAANGQELFSFGEGGMTVTEVSPGPIFAERSHTLGQGTFLIGATVTGLSLSSVRGIDIDNLEFVFTHEDDNPPSLGSRGVEDDLILVRTDLQLNLLATSFVAAYGLSRRLDVSVLVPIVRASLSGTSLGLIDEAILGSGNHAFDESSGRSISSTTSVDGSAVGVGDLGIRLKLNLYQTPKFGIAIAGDVRLPTGDKNDFLGAGETVIRGAYIISLQYGNFAPHWNAGFAARSGSLNSSLQGALGFDQRLGNGSATLALDLLGDFQVGDSDVIVPPPATFASTSPRSTTARTNIPEERDNILDAAVGLKINGGNNFRIVTTVLLPLLDGGMRPTVLWSFGLEKVFGARGS